MFIPPIQGLTSFSRVPGFFALYSAETLYSATKPRTSAGDPADVQYPVDSPFASFPTHFCGIEIGRLQRDTDRPGLPVAPIDP